MARNKRDQTPDRPAGGPVTAVEEAGVATADGPEAVTGGAAATAAVVGSTVGAREIGAEFEGQAFELTEDQVAEATEPPPEDGAGLLGRVGRESVEKGQPGDDLLGTVDSGAPPADPRERVDQGNPFFDEAPEPGVETTDVKEAGIFDLIGQSGASDGDPLTSFLGAAEAKVGRDSGLTTPGDEAEDLPDSGSGAVAAGFDSTHVRYRRDDPSPRATNAFQVDTLYNTVNRIEVEKETNPYSGRLEATTVTNEDNHTQTTVFRDGSTKTVDTQTGKVIDETPPLVDPGPDGDEGAPLPADLQAQLDSEVGRFRQLRPDTGDGTTDPSEIESEAVGPAGDLPDHAAVGQDLFGQPDTEAPTGGGGTFAPGTSSHGTDVITPAEDQEVAAGRQRNDDPFGDADGSLESAADAGDDGGGDSVLLPPDTIADDVVDPAGGLPDALDLPD